jgi:hypothetical protein
VGSRSTTTAFTFEGFVTGMDNLKTVRGWMEAAKAQVMKRQLDLLAKRNDLSDRPAQ